MCCTNLDRARVPNRPWQNQPNIVVVPYKPRHPCHSFGATVVCRVATVVSILAQSLGIHTVPYLLNLSKWELCDTLWKIVELPTWTKD